MGGGELRIVDVDVGDETVVCVSLVEGFEDADCVLNVSMPAAG